MMAIPPPTPPTTPPRIAREDDFGDLELLDCPTVGLGVLDAGLMVDVEFWDRTKVCVKMSASSGWLQPPRGDVRLLFPEEL